MPRALFALDGSFLHVISKSDCIEILKLPSQQKNVKAMDTLDDTGEDCRSVAIVDGMAELQCLDRPSWIQTGKRLSCHLIDELWTKCDQYDETHLVFDRYDEAAVSLKASTRKRRLAEGNAIAYHITDTTAVGKLCLKLLLSHSSTKDELTASLQPTMGNASL